VIFTAERCRLPDARNHGSYGSREIVAPLTL
jgi:hypothetical protein